MRVEAMKVRDGFLLPFVGGLQTITRPKVLLEITVLDQEDDDDEIERFFNRYHFGMNDMRFDREEANAR